MIEGCLLLVWAFLLLVWLLWETWLRQFAAPESPAAAAVAEVADELPNRRRIKFSMDESEISAGGGGEEKSQKSGQGVATLSLDGSAFSLQELHLQLKQMECMIKMLLPYKEKLEALHQLPSTESTCKLSCGSEGDVTLSDLCTRLKVLESENQSLVIENGSQRLKFERCLDQVAIHVAHVLLAQQTLRGECLHLHQRVLRLEQQNHQLFKCFHHQLESLRHPKGQETQSPREHIYEIPEFFQFDQKEGCTKTSPDDKPNSSSSMYDSLEAEYPSALCSTSWNPIATTSNLIQFGVRSQTIPPDTSPRSRLHCTRCTADAGCHGNYQAATASGHNRFCSKKDSFEAECGFGNSGGGGGFRVKGVLSESVGVSSDLEKNSVGMMTTRPGVSICGVETKYGDLMEENRDREFESMESSVNDDAEMELMSPAADLLCLSDSFYEQFRISDRGGQLSVERGDFCIESDDKEAEEFCIESDDTQSLCQGSDALTRASSVSLSELLGRTPNMTSDSDTLSVDDYPFLDYRAKGSIIEENSNEDSDYEELIADEDAVKSHQRADEDALKKTHQREDEDVVKKTHLGGCSDVQNTPCARIPDTDSTLSSGCRKNKEMLSPSREQNGKLLSSPPGERNLGFCGFSSPTSSRLSKQTHHSGPHINVLSRCTNKKLKSAADKIFSASCRVRPVRAFQEAGDDSRFSTGTTTSPFDRTSSKMEIGHHHHQEHPVVGSGKDRDIQNHRPSFLKISNFHRHPVKGVADKGRIKDGEGLSPAFLPSGDFLWDNDNQSSAAHALSSAAHAQSSDRSKTAAISSHTYVNISALNLNQKPRPLLARRKLHLPSSTRSVVHGSSKRGCPRSSSGINHHHKSSPSKTSGGTPLSSHSHNSMDSSPDSDVQRSAFSSSSDSETVTEEKLPSSQDDGYSSNSLPSETSSRQLVEMSRLRSRPSRRDEQRGFVRRKTGANQRIVPILGSRDDLSTFEEGCEGKSDVDVDLNRMNLDDDDGDSVEGLDEGGGSTRPLHPPFPVSDVDDSCFVVDTDSSLEGILGTDGSSANRTPVQEFLNEDEED